MDDQRVDREGGELSDAEQDHAIKGLLNTMLVMAIAGIACLTTLSLWGHFHPSIAPKAGPPDSIRDAIAGGIFGGAALGAAAGAICGLGVMLVRMFKK
jgi:hypothetical protein